MLSANGLFIMFIFGIGVGIAIEGFLNLRKLRQIEKLQNYVFMTTQEEKIAYRKEIGNE